MEGMLDGPFFFTNCDTLIEADYEQIYRQHVRDKNIATIVCATQKVTIPYGTVSVKQDGQLLEMQEKPQYSFLINTGFYLLDSKIMGYIPENTFIHITEIIEKCCLAGERVGVFPISELQWSDMGQLAELRNMQKKKKPSIDKQSQKTYEFTLANNIIDAMKSACEKILINTKLKGYLVFMLVMVGILPVLLYKSYQKQKRIKNLCLV